MMRKALVLSLALFPMIVHASADNAATSAKTPEKAASSSVSSPTDDVLLPGQQIFYGRVDAMPKNGSLGVWEIAGRRVKITEKTRIEFKRRAIRIGDRVDIVGSPEGNLIEADLLRKR